MLKMKIAINFKMLYIGHSFIYSLVSGVVVLGSP